jgi:hypothetical protein
MVARGHYHAQHPPILAHKSNFRVLSLVKLVFCQQGLTSTGVGLTDKLQKWGQRRILGSIWTNVRACTVEVVSLRITRAWARIGKDRDRRTKPTPTPTRWPREGCADRKGSFPDVPGVDSQSGPMSWIIWIGLSGWPLESQQKESVPERRQSSVGFDIHSGGTIRAGLPQIPSGMRNQIGCVFVRNSS